MGFCVKARRLHHSRDMKEIARKLAAFRKAMVQHKIQACHLRSVGWFSWFTGGGNDTVILSSESGIASLLITPHKSLVITSAIESTRLKDEEVDATDWEVWSYPWSEPERATKMIRELVGHGIVASDRPEPEEASLPRELQQLRWDLGSEECERYRKLGRDAAEAMTEAMTEAKPDWTEFTLAAAGAATLWQRGIYPDLILVAGDRRLPHYRHPVPTAEKIGRRAMMVFCGRRHGLYANLTRFVYFESPKADEMRAHNIVAEVEAEAFRHSVPGASLRDIFEGLVNKYAELGHEGEFLRHHQGGITGYQSRESIADLTNEARLPTVSALAWNPSLPGAKIEDTVLCTSGGIEIVTRDAKWPVSHIQGRDRPGILMR